MVRTTCLNKIVLMIASLAFVDNVVCSVQEKDVAYLQECIGHPDAICRFSIYQKNLKITNSHLLQTIDFYYQGSLAFRGYLKALEPQTESQVDIIVKGKWLVANTVVLQIQDRAQILHFAPFSSKLEAHQLDIRTSYAENSVFELSNQWNEPLLFVVAKLGHPQSSSSRNGLSVEYHNFRSMPWEFSLGHYESSPNILTGTAGRKLESISLGRSILLGKKGSQLVTGASLVGSQVWRNQLQKGAWNIDEKKRYFFSIVPKIGMRFTSDNFYLLTIDIGKGIPIGARMENFIGITDISGPLPGADQYLTTLGIGVGI